MLAGVIGTLAAASGGTPGDLTAYVGVNTDNGRWSVPGTDFAVGSPLYLGDWAGGGGRASNGFFLFQNLIIPVGVTATAALFTVTGAGGSANTVNVKVHANDIDDAIAPTSYAEANALALTTAYVEWNALPTFVADTEYSPADITAVIQEVLDRPGRAETFDLMILLMNNASSNNAWRQVKVYADAKPAEIYIAWTT